MISILSKESFDKKYYAINGDVVITGAMDKDGNVHALSDESIKQKVETVFYSPFSTLVIPKTNEEAATETLKTLNERWTSRKLEIIAVKTIHDLFDRRKITTQNYLTIPQRAKKTLQHYRKPIIAVAAIVPTLILGLYLLLIADFDKNPALVTADGNYFLVKNKNGKELWRDLIGAKEKPYLYDARWAADLVSKYVVLIDIDNDGKNEVFITHPISKKDFSDKISCFNYDGSLRYKLNVGAPTETIEGNYREDIFGVLRILYVDNRIICIAQNIYYSCFIESYNVNGERLGQYLHLGQLRDAIIINNKSDGKNYLILAGTHNGFQQPVALMFDVENINGVCPQEESHRLIYPEMKPGTEKCYLKFPQTDVGNYLMNKDNLKAKLTFPNDSTFEIEVETARMPPFLQRVKDDIASLFYIFDKKMKPITIKTPSSFDLLHSSLVSEGKLHGSVDEQYKKNLMSHIEYWGGKKFVTTPTMSNGEIVTE